MVVVAPFEVQGDQNQVEVISPPGEKPLPSKNSETLPPLPSLRPQIPVGGRLAHFAQNWQEITTNKWVLSVIKRGYKIPFTDLPPLSREPIFFSQSGRSELAEEVEKLLSKRAVERIQPESPGFYSRIFLVPKKNGKMRLIIDLSNLNNHVLIQSFRMETQQKVRNAIHPNDWAFSLDLTDAYLHVLIHPQSRKYLRFTLNRKVFQFRALPFGLSTSPYVFTHLMSVIATHLHKKAITLFPYLDDWLSKNQNRQLLLEHRHFTVHLISSLGLLINQEKSDLIPSQNFNFIGMEFLTLTNTVRIPLERIQSLLLTINAFLLKRIVTARQFLSLLGKLNAAADFVVLGRLHLRPLQMSLLAQWRPHILPLDHQIQISQNIRHHLIWWNNRQRFLSGVPIKIPTHTHQLFTDASVTGWGAHLEPEGILLHGIWNQFQREFHINLLELMAISIALKFAHPHIINSTVLICTDNTTVVSYIRKQGGTHSPDLCLETWKMFHWCQQNNINIVVRHIPGKFNILADRLSRVTKPIKTEWSLKQSVVNTICQMTNFPNIDLFATRLNHKMPLYVSPIPDSQALAIDALTMDWSRISAYAFPPFHLIPAVLNKVQRSQCKIVLIAPLWPNRPWFPDLLNLLISPPITLPVTPDLLSQLQGKILHQNPQMLALHAWELSSNQSEINSFQGKLQNMSPELDENLLGKSMMQNGRLLPIGQIRGKLIRSRPLLM
ncbi:MAG: reverse transcriptase-like protein [Candidatus Thiodiazotropha sp. (ex Ctena orbiculata)]|nr:reverse transcriptase-like protein [Candidatus Thiodiazotropha taylori]